MREPTFSLRIVSLDYYLAAPIPGLDVCYSSLEGTAVERVPIVRVFGATPAGQKCCLHIHKVMYGPLDAHAPGGTRVTSAALRALLLRNVCVPTQPDSACTHLPDAITNPATGVPLLLRAI